MKLPQLSMKPPGSCWDADLGSVPPRPGSFATASPAIGGVAFCSPHP